STSSTPRDRHRNLVRAYSVDADALVRFVARCLAALDLDVITIRILQCRHEDFRLTRAVRLVDETESAGLALELHLQRTARDGAGVRAYKPLQRAPSTVYVRWIDALIDAVDGQVFLIPAVANRLIVAVRGRVVPLRRIHEQLVERVVHEVERDDVLLPWTVGAVARIPCPI